MSPPPVTKDRISPPLEAGPSLLDAQQLHPQLAAALEYVSARLARKGLQLSLVVARRDIQIPAFASGSPPPSPSSARARFGGSKSSLASCASASTASLASTASSSWSRAPRRPATATPLNPYGIALMHACALTPKTARILSWTVAKAEKKFAIGSGWLSPTSLGPSPASPLTAELLQRTLAQNSRLFAGAGLTLLALDHVYTFKCALHAYSRSLAPADLTAAVDELRRLVLAQHGRRPSEGSLMRAYAWLGVSLAALVDVNEGYKVAYGGPARSGGVEVGAAERRAALPPPPIDTSFARPTRTSSSPLGSVAFGESAKGREGAWDQVLAGGREDRGPHRRGAVTPNGLEDITPVTRGEWCFLMVGEGWSAPRTAPVVMC